MKTLTVLKNEKINKGEIYTETEDDFNRALTRYGNRLVYQELFEIICFMEFLQQEQPKVDLVAELKHHLSTTPKEQLEKEWKELEPWDNVGPTVQEFLYGNQPEVELEDDFLFDEVLNVFDSFKRLPPRDKETLDFLENLARHFWNKGYNARKEE